MRSNILRVLAVAGLVAAFAAPGTALAQDPDALWRAGAQAARSGDSQGCIDNLRAALQAGGEAYERWGWLHMTLGQCLAQRNQRDEAISELQTAKDLVAEDQEHFNVNNTLAQVYISRGASGDYDRAIAAENEAGQYAGDANMRGLHSKTLGQAYYFKEDWANAVQHLGDAAAARATDSDVAQKLGRAHFESGNTTQAKQWFEKTLSLDRNNNAAITNLGRLFLDEQDYAQAVSYLGRAVQADPQNMQIRNMLGRAYLGQQDYTNAISQLTQVVQGRSSDGNAHYNLGQAYQASGDDARAIDSYGNALRYLAAGTPARAGALYDVGFVYEKVGNFEDALGAFEDAAAINPDAKTVDAIERVKERIRRQKSGS
jgi:tetratricopeptide (TPR) repeat protein